ncbi:NADPH-dependent FMN reductase [Devosia neptuniae]|jgi:chromate reductase, NAD(P)H dehydrogenase (quinone)|uniref:NADPH-dependent FMN reductase n=1 Tax=Devosia TaxID=46913 RepID=UPI0022AED9CB|nr:NADPH-dependent FMN reductase [Devosia neptuniae]MCZ4347442.1 NAD(P)H-dependent oxidoreductase [Devosia neptuniae]|tara:strand:+ start:2064 stop:2609 length:546 start_codon:yes stop_codon:yes gene_type:complete
MTTALTLSGSIRQGSHNLKLQAHMGRQLEAAGVSVNAINLGDFNLPIFNEDLEADAVPQGAVALAELWRSHDIVFIATPEYNGGLPPLLVNAITWVSRQRPSPFRHAVFGIGGVSSGKYGTIWSLSHLRESLTKVGALVVPTLLGIGPAEEAFDAQQNFVEPAIVRKVDQMVHELTHFSRG